MNPEEGELRPQLLDRFGLTVEVRASREPSQRAEVVRRRLAFEADPEGFAATVVRRGAGAGAADRRGAGPAAPGRLPDAALWQIATVCAAFEVDGLRADLVTASAAIAHAAWQGRTAVTADDVREAARLALPHRRRRDPFDAPGLDESKLEDLLDQIPETPDGPGPEDSDPDDSPPEGPAARRLGTRWSGSGGPGRRWRPCRRRRLQQPPATPDVRAPAPRTPARRARRGAPSPADPKPATGSGGREQTFDADPAARTRLFTVPGVGAGAPGTAVQGHDPPRPDHRRPRPRGAPGSLHLTATVAPPRRTSANAAGAAPACSCGAATCREAVREGREGNLVLFVVDASGSMAARQRMRAVKTAVLGLLLDAYQRRDKVGLVTFRGTRADLGLPPTSSVEAGAARLRELPTGGRTPLAAGLLRAAEVLRVERLRDPARRPLLVLVTDGRATSGTVEDVRPRRGTPGRDSERGGRLRGRPRPPGPGRSPGGAVGAETVRLDDLTDLAGMVRRAPERRMTSEPKAESMTMRA